MNAILKILGIDVGLYNRTMHLHLCHFADAFTQGKHFTSMCSPWVSIPQTLQEHEVCTKP